MYDVHKNYVCITNFNTYKSTVKTMFNGLYNGQ